jgi:hypothetical protein
VKYAHLFWRLFGLPITGWDDLLYHDLIWMKAGADDWVKQQREAARG